MNEATSPTFDFLILADRAEAINGKLYLMGGGWDTLNVINIEEPASFGIAVGIMVPWLATNQEHQLTLRLQDPDGKELLRIQAGFRTGRPAMMPDGSEQRVMLALPLNIKFPKPDRYVIVGQVGTDVKRVSLQVNTLPQMGFMAPTPR